MRHFKTTFISEVKLDASEAILVSTRGDEYKIKLETTDEKQSFKTWFKDKFMNCVPQTVTMVEAAPGGYAKLVK